VNNTRQVRGRQYFAQHDPQQTLPLL
jgi:hypothetical protein